MANPHPGGFEQGAAGRVQRRAAARGGSRRLSLLRKSAPAVTAGFNANITLRTVGNKQSVAIRADSQFRAANISLSK